MGHSTNTGGWEGVGCDVMVKVVHSRGAYAEGFTTDCVGGVDSAVLPCGNVKPIAVGEGLTLPPDRHVWAPD